MGTVLVIIAVAVVVIAAGALISYNRFVGQRQYVRNSWSNVDTELRRRYDLIPNLVETVKGYATHEKQTLQAVIEARTRAFANHGAVGEQARDENLLVDALKSLMAVSEAYPDLKANESFLRLQAELVTTENRIQAARRFYNNNVRDYNRRVQSVPSNIVAGLFNFSEEEYFQVEPAVRPAPDVTLS